MNKIYFILIGTKHYFGKEFLKNEICIKTFLIPTESEYKIDGKLHIIR